MNKENAFNQMTKAEQAAVMEFAGHLKDFSIETITAVVTCSTTKFAVTAGQIELARRSLNAKGEPVSNGEAYWGFSSGSLGVPAPATI